METTHGCCNGSVHLSRLSVTLSLILSAVMIISSITDRWLHTTEVDPNTNHVLEFRLGMFQLCHEQQSAECYSLFDGGGWQTNSRALGLGAVFTISVAERTRWIAPVLMLATLLSGIAALLSLTGHCKKSQCTSIAAALLVLAGLLLGGTLITFVNIVSHEYVLRPLGKVNDTKYRLGACFYACTGAILLAELTALMLTHSQQRTLTSSPPEQIKFAAPLQSETANQNFSNQSASDIDEEEEEEANPQTANDVEEGSMWVPKPFRDMNSRTLPSRGRYAKQVTFKLEDISPKLNGSAHVKEFRESSTLPRFMSSHFSNHLI